MTFDTGSGLVAGWLSALEARHLADLRVPEVTRALRALSSAYVQRRRTVARGATLDSAGKRAAFALFYAPLHFITTMRVVEALEAAVPPPSRILDIGCGTGAAGAAWALAAGGMPAITGIDRQKVGQVAAEMRGLRPPDPYKNKGVRYSGERLKKKVGKTGAK